MVALRQSAEVTRWVRERMLRRARRDQEPVSPLSLELAEYFILWTSLKKLPTTEVLELYRLRWQIEFVGLLIERMVDAAASFFPWGYPVATAAEPLAGNRVYVPPSRSGTAPAPKPGFCNQPMARNQQTSCRHATQTEAVCLRMLG